MVAAGCSAGEGCSEPPLIKRTRSAPPITRARAPRPIRRLRAALARSRAIYSFGSLAISSRADAGAPSADAASRGPNCPLGGVATGPGVISDADAGCGVKSEADPGGGVGPEAGEASGELAEVGKG